MTNQKWKAPLIINLLSIISILAIQYNAQPKIYLGYFFALFLIFFIGNYAGKKSGATLGFLIVGLGLLLRKFFPIIENLKNKKLEEFLVQNEAYSQFINSYFIGFLLLGALIGFLGGFLAEHLDKQDHKPMNVNTLSYMGFFVALSVVINTLRIGNISFGGFPIILSGYFLGPINGFIIGAVSDVLGFLIRPSAFSFNPLFTLTSALTGLIPVLINNILGEKYPNYSFWKMLLGILIGQFLTSVILVPLFQVWIYGNRTFLYYFTAAAAKQAFSIPIYAFLGMSLLDRLSKILKLIQVRPEK